MGERGGRVGDGRERGEWVMGERGGRGYVSSFIEHWTYVVFQEEHLFTH